MASTAKKALRGTFFVAIGSYSSLAIYFLTGIVLARLLNPSDFGLYRLSLFFADLFARVREFGLDKALIHKQEGLPNAYRTHFTLQVLLSFVSFLLALFFGPVLLRFYPKTVFFFILIISLGYLFQALSSTQRIFLEKNLSFGRTAVIDIASLFFASLFSIFLAFKGFGPLSLVVGYAANYAIISVLLWLFRPWRVRLREVFLFNRSEMIWFTRFGFFLFVGGLTTFVLYKYNDFVLGTFLSITALGFYSRAFNYAQIPTSLITSVVSKVALPTYSALQEDSRKIAESFSIVLKSIVRVSFPLSLGLYLLADDFTLFLLGRKWLPMVPIFRVLLVYGVFRSIFDDLGEFFTALGRPRLVSIYLLFQSLVGLFLAPLLIHFYGAVGAALSLSVVLILGVVLAYYFLGRIITVRIKTIFLPTIVTCALTAAFFEVVFSFLKDNSSSLFLSLLIKGFIFGLIYLVFLIIIDGRSFLVDLRFIWAHLRLKERGDGETDDLILESV